MVYDSRVYVKCLECKKTFFYYAYRKKRKYCSRACCIAHRKKVCAKGGRKRKRLCLNCKKSFTSFLSVSKSFCCRKCYGEYVAKNYKKWKSTWHRRRKYKQICETCGKPFYRLYRKRRFCSRKCYYASPLYKPKKLWDGWSKDYAACKMCGKTTSPHKSHGLCTRCSSRLRQRKNRGVHGKICAICGEKRAVCRAHVVARARGGANAEWNILYLCATHHRCFDVNELTVVEFKKVEKRVLAAFRRAKRICWREPVFTGG